MRQQHSHSYISEHDRYRLIAHHLAKKHEFPSSKKQTGLPKLFHFQCVCMFIFQPFFPLCQLMYHLKLLWVQAELITVAVVFCVKCINSVCVDVH